MKLIPVFFTVSVLILAFSCAKQTSPSGGPRDTIPPTLISSIPPNKAVNFKGYTITLNFNEYITLNNPQEQLLITPSIGKEFEMSFKKKTATLKLNTTLDDNTTYTINFRESIQDITEKNPAENLQMAFSTGGYLDSLAISGMTYDILTGKELKDMTVALYLNADTFNIFEHKPTYLTKTNEKGTFKIENLKAGKYYIYAFNDKNRNIVVDSKSESYGFISTPVDLEPGKRPNLAIPLFKLDSRELKLVSAKPYNTYFNIKLSKGIAQFDIKPVNPGDSVLFKNILADDKVSVKVYLQTNDSIPINFLAQDTIGFQIDTTLYAKRSERKVTPEKFNTSIEKPYIIAGIGKLSTRIKFNKPITGINYDSIFYQYDSATSIPSTPNDISWDKSSLFIQIPLEKKMIDSLITKPNPAPKKPNRINKFLFGKGAFTSIENDSSTHKEESVNILTPESTGTIIVNVDTQSENFIIQLLQSDYSVYQSISNQKSFSFTNLAPGDYYIRLIQDENANQQWDPGNFFQLKEPEKIVFYKNEEGSSSISIKANWELGPLLITDEQNVDNQ